MRCATAVSVEMTRSRFCATAAVSRKAPGPLSNSGPRSSTRNCPATSAICSEPAPFCKAISRTPRDGGERAPGASSGSERPLSTCGSGLPCQIRPTRKPDFAPSRTAQRSTRSGSGGEIGFRAGDAVRRRAEAQRQAHQVRDIVDRRHLAAPRRRCRRRHRRWRAAPRASPDSRPAPAPRRHPSAAAQ